MRYKATRILELATFEFGCRTMVWTDGMSGRRSQTTLTRLPEGTPSHALNSNDANLSSWRA